MTSEPRPAFDRSMAERYDDRNRPLAPISQALHFLSGLALADVRVAIPDFLSTPMNARPGSLNSASRRVSQWRSR